MNSSKPPREVRVSLGDRQSALPDREEVPRIVRLLALAHRWHRLIDEGEIRDQAEVARRVGLTRARVTQIMSLIRLSPRIQARLASGIDGVQQWRAASSAVYWPWQTRILGSPLEPESRHECDLSGTRPLRRRSGGK